MAELTKGLNSFPPISKRIIVNNESRIFSPKIEINKRNTAVL